MKNEPKTINTNNMVVPIEEVRPNTWNPKLDYNASPEGQKQYARITKSIARHGQIDPLLVRETDKGYEIVNGYHRYRVALDLGWKEIEIKNLGKIADSKAKAIALATEDAKLPLDQIEVAKLVRDMLAFDPQSFDDMPYNAEDTEGMQKLLSFDWDGFKEDLKEEEPHDDSEGYKIILPSDRLTAWRDLKTIKGAESDTELLVMLIDEQGLTYEKDHDKSKEEAAPNSRDQKARGQGKK